MIRCEFGNSSRGRICAVEDFDRNPTVQEAARLLLGLAKRQETDTPGEVIPIHTFEKAFFMDMQYYTTVEIFDRAAIAEEITSHMEDEYGYSAQIAEIQNFSSDFPDFVAK